MFCSKCGAPNADGTVFCVRCGNPLQNPSTPAPSPQPQPGKNPLVAGFLNLFIGLGYLYLGYEKVLGLPTILFVLVVLVIDLLVGFYTFGLIPLVLAILLAYDGYAKAKGGKGYVNAAPAAP